MGVLCLIGLIIWIIVEKVKEENAKYIVEQNAKNKKRRD